ncbi:hypothetical protein [Nonomuraea sp. NPDC049028]|uniref:hypothetical protein n=1 Tax=Nonomuraea sp. NPDC049028 TaxID=3364348 RepID=UPI00371B8D86
MKRTPSTDNQAELAARFAMVGKDDPSIARILECSVSHVRALRKEYEIDPGETRWLPNTSPLNTRYATPADSEEG